MVPCFGGLNVRNSISSSATACSADYRILATVVVLAVVRGSVSGSFCCGTSVVNDCSRWLHVNLVHRLVANDRLPIVFQLSEKYRQFSSNRFFWASPHFSYR